MNAMEQLKILKEVNEILQRHSMPQLAYEDVTFTNKTFLVREDKTLAKKIESTNWPSISSAVVYHYTTATSLKSILSSNSLRLYSVEKRYTEAEIVAFCQSYNLKGFLEQENGEPLYKKEMLSTHYISFTDTSWPPVKEDYFWRTFSNGEGVRLKIDVTAQSPNFRRVFYKNNGDSVLQLYSEISNYLDGYGLKFVFGGISRYSAFYLPSELAKEEEYRALYQCWPNAKCQPKSDGKYSYIEVPLGIMGDAGFKFEITEIQTDEELGITGQYSKIVIPRTN